LAGQGDRGQPEQQPHVDADAGDQFEQRPDGHDDRVGAEPVQRAPGALADQFADQVGDAPGQAERAGDGRGHQCRGEDGGQDQPPAAASLQPAQRGVDDGHDEGGGAGVPPEADRDRGVYEDGQVCQCGGGNEAGERGDGPGAGPVAASQ